MEKTMINLMDNILTDEDIKYINALEARHKIEDDVYAMINDIKLFFFKKGLKAGVELLKFCDEMGNN